MTQIPTSPLPKATKYRFSTYDLDRMEEDEYKPTGWKEYSDSPYAKYTNAIRGISNDRSDKKRS